MIEQCEAIELAHEYTIQSLECALLILSMHFNELREELLISIVTNPVIR